MARIEHLCGSTAALMVPVIWSKIPARIKRYVLWDIPEREREHTFFEVISRSVLTTYVWDDSDHLKACAWLQSYSEDAVISHFFFCDGADDSISARYWHDIQSLGIWEWAYALLPIKFRHVIRYAEKFGFKKCVFLPDLVCIDGKGKSKAVLLRKRIKVS